MVHDTALSIRELHRGPIRGEDFPIALAALSIACWGEAQGLRLNPVFESLLRFCMMTRVLLESFCLSYLRGEPPQELVLGRFIEAMKVALDAALDVILAEGKADVDRASIANDYRESIQDRLDYARMLNSKGIEAIYCYQAAKRPRDESDPLPTPKRISSVEYTGSDATLKGFIYWRLRIHLGHFVDELRREAGPFAASTVEHAAYLERILDDLDQTLQHVRLSDASKAESLRQEFKPFTDDIRSEMLIPLQKIVDNPGEETPDSESHVEGQLIKCRKAGTRIDARVDGQFRQIREQTDGALLHKLEGPAPWSAIQEIVGFKPGPAHQPAGVQGLYKLAEGLHKLADSLDPVEQAQLREFVTESLPELKCPCGEAERPWRNALLRVAVNLQFADDGRRAAVAAALYANARAIMNQQARTDDDQAALLAAWRRYCAMLSVKDAGKLREFLTFASGSAAEAAAITCVQNVFESEEPGAGREYPELGDAIYHKVKPSLAADQFSAGPIAAVALAGITALASLGDSRFRELLHDVELLGKPWLKKEINAQLQELLKRWEARYSQLQTDTNSIRKDLQAAVEQLNS